MKRLSRSPRIRQFVPLLLVLLSALVAIAAYLKTLDFPFISDDIIYVYKNNKLAVLPLAELWRLFTEPYNSMEFLPLRDLSYWFDIALFGMNPFVFRIHNLLLYLFCLPLAYGTTLGVWRYFRPADATSAPWAAAVVTALFALHPAHVEAVVWVSGRKDVQATMLALLALWLAVRTMRKPGFSAFYAALTMVAFVAAMLSKATAVAVAPVIAMLWINFWCSITVSNRPHSQLLWPLTSLLLAACITLIFAANSPVKAPAYFGVEVVTRALAVLGWLARLAVTPESRHFFYPVLDDPLLPVMVTLGVAVLIVAVASIVITLRQRSLESFSLGTFLLLCMPYMQLIPYSTPSLVTDRWLALAVWPAILLVVALAWRLKPFHRTALLLAITLPWCFQTAERPRDWRSYEALVDADLRTYPGYHMPAVGKIIGVQLPQGLTREASKTASSITAPEIRNIMIGFVEADYAVHTDAISIGNPQNAMILLRGLGLDLKQPPTQAKWDLPLNYFWKSMQDIFANELGYLAEHFPDNALVHYNAGLWMLEAHKYKIAVAYLRTATESQHLPQYMYGTAFYNLGLALMGSGHIVEAEVPLRAALEQSQPDLRAYCLLLNVYKQTKRFEEAARAGGECSKQAPSKNIAQ